MAHSRLRRVIRGAGCGSVGGRWWRVRFLLDLLRWWIFIVLFLTLLLGGHLRLLLLLNLCNLFIFFALLALCLLRCLLRSNLLLLRCLTRQLLSSWRWLDCLLLCTSHRGRLYLLLLLRGLRLLRALKKGES